MNVNRLQWKFPLLLLAAGIAGGMLVVGCSGKGARQEAVATVNDDPVKVGELRELLGVPAGVFAVPDLPAEKKKEALDQLVGVRLLAQEGRSLGLDNTPEFKEILRQNEPLILVKALVRKEIEGKLKVTNEEIKAEIAKVKKARKGIPNADAVTWAVKSVSGSRVRKIEEDLLAVAKKETGAAADPAAVPRNGKEDNVSGSVVPADRDLTMRALAAYARKQGVDGSDGYKSTREEMERFVLRDMVANDIIAKNVAVTDKEIEADFAKRTASLAPAGTKIPAAMVTMLKERIREALRKEKGQSVLDAHIDGLRKKAKITVNDSVLPKV